MHPTSGPSIHGIATGHLNGGTKTDIVVTLKDTHQVSFLLGRGDGTFQQKASDSGYLRSIYASQETEAPVQVIIVDLDQDGFGDIVTSNEGCQQCSHKGSVSVLINAGFAIFP